MLFAISNISNLRFNDSRVHCLKVSLPIERLRIFAIISSAANSFSQLRSAYYNRQHLPWQHTELN